MLKSSLHTHTMVGQPSQSGQGTPELSPLLDVFGWQWSGHAQESSFAPPCSRDIGAPLVAFRHMHT
eukprot:scaffold281_cov318-Pavlova_lutheri.AAC.37